jgi:hypothetical protein
MDATALACIRALDRGGAPPADPAAGLVVVVADAPHEALAPHDAPPLDAARFPGVRAPRAAHAAIGATAARAVAAAGRARRVCVTGYGDAAAVAAYAAVCARATLAHTGGAHAVECVTFGVPIAVPRAVPDAGAARHYVLTTHTACFSPGVLDAAGVTWLGEADAAFYVHRLVGFFVRPAFAEPLAAYAAAFAAHDDLDAAVLVDIPAAPAALPEAGADYDGWCVA